MMEKICDTICELGCIVTDSICLVAWFILLFEIGKNYFREINKIWDK